MLDQYTYVFVIGTLFAMLDAYNNGASKLLSPSLASLWAVPSAAAPSPPQPNTPKGPASVC
jgi:hypothetical protein